MTPPVRLSDPERDRLIEALRQHFVDGRLELEEYEHRVGVILVATTRDEADAALADLPALPPAPPARRSRRHGEATAPQAHWRATNEVFRDPTSGRVTRVWVDPVDGVRHYVVES